MEHLAKCACGATDKVACFHSGCKDRDVTTDHRTVGDVPQLTMHRVTAKYFEVDPPQVDYCQSCPTSANCHAAQQCLAHDFFPDGDAHDFFPDGDPVDHIADAGKMIVEALKKIQPIAHAQEPVKIGREVYNQLLKKSIEVQAGSIQLITGIKVVVDDELSPNAIEVKSMLKPQNFDFELGFALTKEPFPLNGASVEEAINALDHIADAGKMVTCQDKETLLNNDPSYCDECKEHGLCIDDEVRMQCGKMIFQVCQACDCLHKCDELGTCYKELQRINIEEHHFNNHL